MSVYSTLSRFAHNWRAARERAVTRRILGTLPNEVLKDIGWPEVDDRNHRAAETSLYAGR